MLVTCSASVDMASSVCRRSEGDEEERQVASDSVLRAVPQVPRERDDVAVEAGTGGEDMSVFCSGLR